MALSYRIAMNGDEVKPCKFITCNICQKEFFQNSEFEVHMKTHTDKMLFTCTSLERPAPSKVSTPKSVTEIFTPKHLFCEICKRLLDGKMPIKGYMRKQSQQKVFICLLCEYTHFHSKSPAPVIFAVRDKSQDCKTCDKNVPDKAAVKRPEIKHKKAVAKPTPAKGVDGKPHLCSICGDCFADETALDLHVIGHNKVLPFAMTKVETKFFSCQICQKRCTDETSFKLHLATHDTLTPAPVRRVRTNPYVCEICDKGFTDVTAWKLHIIEHDEMKPSFCDTCNRYIWNSAEYESHMSSHKVAVPSFNPEESSTCKMESVDTDGPYTCKVCEQCFTQKHQLANHMVTHTNEKPFICNVCGELFALEAVLKNHLLVHRNQATLKCDICDKIFLQKRTLFRHLAIHNKPFLCRFCKRGFNLEVNYNKHMLLHGIKTSRLKES